MKKETKRRLREAAAYMHTVPPLLLSPYAVEAGLVALVAVCIWTVAGLVAGWNASQFDIQKRAADRARLAAFELDAQLMKAASVLRNAEWKAGPHESQCPYCFSTRGAGHHGWCLLSKILNEEM